MRLFLTVPSGNTDDATRLAQAFVALHGLNAQSDPVVLAWHRRTGQLGLGVELPQHLRSAVTGQLYAALPGLRIDVNEETGLAGQECWSAPVRIHPAMLPLRSSQPPDPQAADPLVPLLSLLGDPGAGWETEFEIHTVPAPRRLVHRLRRTLALRGIPGLGRLYAYSQSSGNRRGRAFAATLDLVARFDVALSVARLLRPHEPAADDALFCVRLRLTVRGPPSQEATAQRKLRELVAALSPCIDPSRAALSPGRIRRGSAPLPWRRCARHAISPLELTRLWHFPNEFVRPPRLATVHFREFEPPADLPVTQGHQGIASLGDCVYRGRAIRCGLLPDDRRRHMLLLGKTGMGKSTLLLHLLSSDIAAGRGVGLIDPHGDLAEAVLRVIPSQRTNDVVLFDAGDQEHPPAFNPLDCPDPRWRPLLASGLVSAFKRVFGDSWGPRLEHILRNSVLTLLDVPGTTLVSLQRMLSDASYRKDLLHRTNDPVVRGFWEREFAAMPARLQAEALSPVQNKVGHFVSNPILRHIVGQSRSKLDVRRIMDEGKVLLCNLSKGRVGDDGSQLLGAFLVTSIQLAAMSRADLPEGDRREFFLTIDEFGTFATDSFASALSESRKYGLALSLANQYLAQLEPSMRSAVFGNVGSLLAFQVGAEDSETLARQIGGDVAPHDLLQLPRYHTYARLLIDGAPARPFLLRTIAPKQSSVDSHRAEIIRRVSRRNLSHPLCDVKSGIEELLV